MQPGVYLDLAEDEYFAAPALGSSDLKRLALSAEDWWWGSRWCPDVQPEPEGDRDARVLGQAMHLRLMSGEAAYRSRYAVKPSPTLPSRKDIGAMRRALAARGVETEMFEKASVLVDKCRDAGVRLKEDEYAVFDLDVAAGKRHLSTAFAARVEATAKLIEASPAIAPLLKGGLTEVSVFWEHAGVLHRARFDKLLPQWILDLKTITPRPGQDLRRAALFEVYQRGYDVQWALYSEARSAAARLAAEGRLVGGTRSDRALAKRMLAVAAWNWAWLFVQVPNAAAGDAGRALRVLPVLPGERGASNPAWNAAASRLHAGRVAFREARSRFPDGAPWVEIQPAWTPEPADWPYRMTDEVLQ